MKVFVTGGTGFIGSHIVVELLSHGHEVTILARNPKKVPSFAETTGISIVEGDLQDYGLIKAALAGHDVCIHNAILWDEEPTELQLKDTRAAVNLFEGAAEAGVGHLVYTSSTAVHRPFQPRMDETQRLAPTDFYGSTKAAGEMFLSAFSYQTAMRCNVVRPGPTVGVPAVEGAPVAVARRLEEIVTAALRGDKIVVAKRDGRQFIGAADLARLYAAVLHSSDNREVFLGVARNFTTWEQIAQEAISLCGSDSVVVTEDRGGAEQLFEVGKIDRHLYLAFDSREAMTAHLRYLIDRDPG